MAVPPGPYRFSIEPSRVAEASEVDAAIDIEATRPGRIEVAVADVCQSPIVRQVGINHLILKAATYLQTSVETLEEVLRE